MSNKYITIFKDNLKTNKGKKLIQFSLFLAISFTFWMAITLNENFHYDVNFPITISNIPPKVTLISETPRSIKVSLNAKGIHYLKFKFWSEPLIKIDFKTHSQNNRISLGNSELQELTRNIFGNNSQALSFAPDSINIYYTNNPGKLVKLFIDHEISTDNRHREHVSGNGITEAKFNLHSGNKYFRITVIDAEGKHANTHAYLIENLK